GGNQRSREERGRAPQGQGKEAAAEKDRAGPSYLRAETAEGLQPDCRPETRPDQPSPFTDRRRSGKEEESRKRCADEDWRRDEQEPDQSQQRSPWCRPPRTEIGSPGWCRTSRRRQPTKPLM